MTAAPQSFQQSTKTPTEEGVSGCYPVTVDAPEIWLDCPECGGEGSFEEYESVSKWSIDPPCGHVIPCKACNGAGGLICEAGGFHD